MEQVPPSHSAVKIGGERAYRKMRQGRSVNIPPRTVEITECKIISFEYPILKLKVACSSGTYIRSLVHDLGQLLRCGGYLAGLRRTKVGDWPIDDAVEIEKINWPDVIPLKEVLADRFKVELSYDQAQDIRQGRDIDVEVKKDAIGWSEGE